MVVLENEIFQQKIEKAADFETAGRDASLELTLEVRSRQDADTKRKNFACVWPLTATTQI